MPVKKASCLVQSARGISRTPLWRSDCEVDKSEVRLPTGALRELGEYEVAIQVHGDVTAMVAVEVVPE